MNFGLAVPVSLFSSCVFFASQQIGQQKYDKYKTQAAAAIPEPEDICLLKPTGRT